jgi:hypothetical protein
VVTKGELPGAIEVRDELAVETGGDVELVSAVTGEGLNRLVRRIAARVDEQKKAAI